MEVKKISKNQVSEEKLGPITRRILFSPSRTGNSHLRLVWLTGEYGDLSPVHTHPGEEALFVLQGEITMTIDGRDYIVGPNEGIVVPPKTEHPFLVTSKESWIGVASFCDECRVLKEHLRAEQ